MKWDLIFGIYVDISSYPYEFSVLRDFIICSISLGVVHLSSILWVRFIKSLFHKMSVIINTVYTQINGANSKVNKKFISHLKRAKRTPSAAATVQVSHALITFLQCVYPGSHDTHPHGNQIHPRLGVACAL